MAQVPRRGVLALGTALPALACAAAPDDRFVHAGGIGSRAGGPELWMRRGPSGFPRADRSNWWQPDHAVDSFSRLDEIFPASAARPGQAASPWRRAGQEPDMRYDVPAFLGGGRYGIDGYLDRNPVTGLLIVQGDTILVERYQYARTDAMRFTSFSMAKTLVALLIGLAVDDGAIRSLDDDAAAVAPALAGLEYGRTPIRHLLTMSSGVQFREEYDGRDDSARLTRASIGGESAGEAAVLRPFNTRIAAPGARWSYASAETFALAMVARAAFGDSLASVLEQRIWRPMGAEAGATWLVDRAGQEIGYMGLNARLRDYGRLGRLLASGGVAQGRQLVPNAWLRAMTRPAFSAAQTGRTFGYGFQTWTAPENDGSFALLGVRGQYMLIDPARRLVMVNTAVRRDPRDRGNAETMALWRSVRSHIG